METISMFINDYHLNNNNNNPSPEDKSFPFNGQMRDQAYDICRRFLSGEWNRISSDDMVFKTVSGGLSNYLYYCSLPSTHTPLNGEPSQVLLRMYGQLLDGNDTKVTDSVITMLLSERNLGPKLYGIFPGGRLEEYIPARAMHCSELKVPIYAEAIARKLATVHVLDVPINKAPTWLFDTFDQWLHSVLNPPEDCQQQNPNLKVEQQLCAFDFTTEIKWLKEFLLSCNSPTVFAHNDLQEGNILLPEKSSVDNFDDTIVFIDFEFCAYNYRGFDLGNHFCERMFDYSNPDFPNYYSYLDAYPTEDDQRLFMKEYIKRSKDLTPGKETEDELMKEANCFTLASHMLWTLWSINNARTSKIQFGYWEYGLTRLTAYKSHKKQVLRKYCSTHQTLKP
ncbi:choline/ethanolamine kinase-like [Oppia nitens]|uniref:choline/ethanolamine kinase-like n=1 Tax=Oppia nitens TaxID=1686743 RepID=UPI0023DC303A|nr:choline/ethanolamine kinase-like [Oppia nitens]